MRMILISILPSSRIMAIFTWYISFVLVRIAVTKAALAVWDKMVARAAPATPMRMPTTRTTSSTILVTQPVIKNSSGLLESPTARKIPEPML